MLSIKNQWCWFQSKIDKKTATKRKEPKKKRTMAKGIKLHVVHEIKSFNAINQHLICLWWLVPIFFVFRKRTVHNLCLEISVNGLSVSYHCHSSTTMMKNYFNSQFIIMTRSADLLATQALLMTLYVMSLTSKQTTSCKSNG